MKVERMLRMLIFFSFFHTKTHPRASYCTNNLGYTVEEEVASSTVPKRGLQAIVASAVFEECSAYLSSLFNC